MDPPATQIPSPSGSQAAAPGAPGSAAGGPDALADPVTLPGITLPKGGGAIRGIDEQLTVDQATGAASMSVPIPTTPGRNGFGPSLTLTYDSTAGNGPCGLGWQYGVTSITRKTSTRLPSYEDAADSDVFVLSAAGDLVPRLLPDGASWTLDEAPDPSGAYTVRRYRPRSEAAFGRIERWREDASGDVHWRTVTKDNVTSLFGQTPASRIADPADPSRVFSWLMDFSYDDRGNAMALQYKAEDSANVPSAAHEQGRVVTANRYLKQVLYGNVVPFTPGAAAQPPTAWLFELIVDYGEHDAASPTPAQETTWPCRVDPFSSYRSGFEIRTYRLCRRLLMFHRFPGGADGDAAIVSSLDLSYSTEQPTAPTRPETSLVVSIVHTGYRVRAEGAPQTAQLPPLQLGYAPLEVDETVAVADPDVLANLPAGVPGAGWRWCDLDGEGLQGVLVEDDGGWYYKRNISAWAPGNAPPAARFEPLALVAEKPSGPGAANAPQLVDLHGDGHLTAVQFSPPTPGYFARDDKGGWEPFQAFTQTAAVDFNDPNVRLVDLDGDGLSDVLLTEDDAFTWYAWQDRDGFGPSQRVATPHDENTGPALVFAEGDWSVYLADMSGDGLSDLVRIRNGEVSYWPNLGRARFGTKVVMDGAPWFDTADTFDARRVHLADIDGSGTTDLIYTGRGGVTLWFSRSGNGFTAPTRLAAMPSIDDRSTITPMDLLGSGTTSLVWSSPLAGDAGRQLRYVDLLGGVKPNLLTSIVNNLGGETMLTYATSTRYYVEDLLAGRPWVTRLSFPVHVVAQRQVADRITGTELSCAYSYHHGYFDGVEREFRGFAQVDQTDAESVPAASGAGSFSSTPTVSGDEFTLAPVLTRSWFHTGAYLDGQEVAAALAAEYWTGDPAATALGTTEFSGASGPEQLREACRCLRGKPLRTEVYALDDPLTPGAPYTVTGQRYAVRGLQPPSGASYGSDYAYQLESVSWHYERVPADPRIGHELTLAVDPYGAVLRSASVGYPRRTAADPEQAVPLIAYVEHDVANYATHPDWYRLGLPVETRAYELTGIAPAPGTLFDVDALAIQAPGIPAIASGATASGTTPQKRLTARSRTIYGADDLSGPLPGGQVQSRALVDRAYRLELTADIMALVYAAQATPAALTAIATGAGGLVDLDGDGNWWAPSARAFYSADPAAPDPAYAAAHFLAPQGHVDPFGGVTAITWEHDLAVVQATDPLHNVTTAQINYRVMMPWLVTDANQNRTGARFDELGAVVASAALGKALDGGADEGDHLDLTTDEPSATDAPTATFAYDLGAYQAWAADPAHDPLRPVPVSTHTRRRIRHQQDGWIQSYTYIDGLGRTVLSKAQAEPGPAPARAADGTLVRRPDGQVEIVPTETRWVGSGRVVFDNKGNPIKAYEPFFDSSPEFTEESDLVHLGVTAIIRYDPLNRPVRVDNPDGSYRTTTMTAWQVTASDEVDNVVGSAWYQARSGGALGPLQQAVAAAAVNAAGTPTVTEHDPLGRAYRTTLDNGPAGRYATLRALDINGRVRAVTDALGRTIMTSVLTLPGAEIHHHHLDAGDRWQLLAADGQPAVAWDARGIRIDRSYDALRRPTDVTVTGAPAGARVAERIVYGEGLADAVARNLRGVAHQRCDSAGVQTTNQRDLDGNVTSVSRQLLAVPTSTVDWNTSPALDTTESFATTTTFDALGRPLTITTPDGSVTAPQFNARSLLAGAAVTVHPPAAAAATPIVTAVTYDAKGQRQSIAYSNGAQTTYGYDPDTFRLITLTTTRPAGAGPLQDLAYVYDPVGNVHHVSDGAQPTSFFSGQVVTADAGYGYDAIYRLISAAGREHVTSGLPPQTSFNDAGRAGLPLPSDGQAIQNYSEAYAYDAVGNLQSMVHAAAVGGWTRAYAYDEPVAPPGNDRLTSTTIGATREPYTYDPNGNMATMPHLSRIVWDYRNLLQSTATQVAAGTPPSTEYDYDLTGARVQKLTRSGTGAILSRRLYVGAWELYREYSPAGAVTLERHSLSVADGDRRVCLIETTTVDTTPLTATTAPVATPSTTVRYQLADRIGSAAIELDQHAQLISYEEYYPYGGTSLQSVTGNPEVSLKRYCWTGRERDTETGFYYHGARYYAPWLGRWASCDPAGSVDGTNLYQYARSNPIRLTDPSGTQSHDQDAPPPPPPAATAGAGGAAGASDPPDNTPGAGSGPGPQSQNIQPLLGITNGAFQGQFPLLTLRTEFLSVVTFGSAGAGVSQTVAVTERVADTVELGVVGSVGTPNSTLGLTLHVGPTAPDDPTGIQSVSGWGLWLTASQVWGAEPPLPPLTLTPPGWSFNPTVNGFAAYSHQTSEQTHDGFSYRRGYDVNLGAQASRWGSTVSVPVAGEVSPFIGLNKWRAISDNDQLNLEFVDQYNFGLGGRQDGLAGPGLPMSNTFTAGFGWQHAFENSDWGIGLEIYGSVDVSPNVTDSSGSHVEAQGGLRFDFGAINPRRGQPLRLNDR